MVISVKIEKKLIALSAVAIVVGVASIVPLLFLMSTKAETPKSWFNVGVPYAYCETRDGAINYSNPLGETINNSSHPVVSERIVILLDLTLDVNLKTETDDARFEYYQMNITTDKGPVETESFQVGTSGNSSFAHKDFQFRQDDRFDTGKFDPRIGGGGGIFIPNWTKGLPILYPEGNSGIGTVGGSGASRVVSALREAQTVYITLYRVGWVSFEGDSTIATFTNNEVICNIQLLKFGSNAWLYNNNFIPIDRLPQIDPAKPVIMDPKTGLNVPNVNP